MTRGPNRTTKRSDVYDVMGSRTKEPWTTKELANELPVGTDTTYKRLRELETLDKIKTKKVGARARIWWIPTPMEDTGAAERVTGERETVVMNAMTGRDDASNAWTTSELEDETGVDSDTLYHVLRGMEDDGVIASKKVGSRARVWWPL